MSIAKYIDHTLLAPDATKSAIEKLCKEASEYKFASVCVNSCWVSLAADLLKDSSVKVCTVVGFPLGAMDTVSKAYEAAKAVEMKSIWSSISDILSPVCLMPSLRIS